MQATEKPAPRPAREEERIGGMTATAEVVVRERRLIDLALDPFRQIGG